MRLKGEPDVTVNGDIVRMIQATDGLWYAYFADEDQAQAADATVALTSYGLDFGSFCASTSTVLGFTVTDTQGIAIASDPIGAGVVGTQGTTTPLGACTQPAPADAPAAGAVQNNVVREAKTPNTNAGAGGIGQIGLNDVDYWPFIQLYDLNPTGNVVVQYNKGGNPQTVTLTFDTLDGTLETSLDREVYPQGAAVHATLTDQALNIDPTDEDSWTFDTDATPVTIYQAFNESGVPAGICGGVAFAPVTTCVAGGAADADNSVTPDISGSLSTFLFEDGGVLLVNVDAQTTGTNVITFQGNQDQVFLPAFDTNASGAVEATDAFSQPVTLVELGPNSGVFANYDELDEANMEISTTALRGTSAVLTWDDTGNSIRVGNDFASIDIVAADDEWNSGETYEVILMDQDANLNTRFDEDLDLNNPEVAIIPSLTVGSPQTLSGIDAATATAPTMGGFAPALAPATAPAAAVAGAGTVTVNVDSFSDRAIFSIAAGNTGDYDVLDTLVIPLGITTGDFNTYLQPNATFKGAAVFNYDLRSLFSTTGTTGVDIALVELGDNFDAAQLNAANADQVYDLVAGNDITAAQGTIVFDETTGGAAAVTALNAALVPAAVGADAELALAITKVAGTPYAPAVGDRMPIVADFFTFGYIDDGADPSERIDNMIVRLELEENGDNTGEFVGELEFVMLNQLNIDSIGTYTGLGTIADDPVFIVSQDFTDEDAPRVNYADLGADGVVTPVADQEDAPSHSGTVSLNSDSYKIADTVEITLEDLDLNVDSDLLEIYTIVSPNQDALFTYTNDAVTAAVDAADTFTPVRGGAGFVAGVVTMTIPEAQPLQQQQHFADADGDGVIDAGELGAPFTGTLNALGATSTVTIAAPANDAAAEAVGSAGLPSFTFGPLGSLLNVTFDDEIWAAQSATIANNSGVLTSCNTLNFSTFNDGFASTGFTLVETSADSGVFKGDFQIPENYCARSSGTGVQATTTGTDIEVNYIDYRDASGEIIEVGDGAGVSEPTLVQSALIEPFIQYHLVFQVTLQQVLQVIQTGRSLFPVHQAGVAGGALVAGTTALAKR